MGGAGGPEKHRNRIPNVSKEEEEQRTEKQEEDAFPRSDLCFGERSQKTTTLAAQEGGISSDAPEELRPSGFLLNAAGTKEGCGLALLLFLARLAEKSL